MHRGSLCPTLPARWPWVPGKVTVVTRISKHIARQLGGLAPVLSPARGGGRGGLCTKSGGRAVLEAGGVGRGAMSAPVCPFTRSQNGAWAPGELCRLQPTGRPVQGPHLTSSCPLS